MKTCNRCNVEKPLTEFYKNSKRVYPYCKACAKQAYAKKHYEENKELYKQRSKASVKNFIEDYKEYKKTLKCSECDENRPWCLAFHHTDPTKKDMTVSSIVLYNSRKKLQEEIDKCIVLCHNCHADLHYRERNAGIV